MWNKLSIIYSNYKVLESYGSFFLFRIILQEYKNKGNPLVPDKWSLTNTNSFF